MGLELPICREVGERHGGSARVQSEEGEGATFTTRLSLER